MLYRGTLMTSQSNHSVEILQRSIESQDFHQQMVFSCYGIVKVQMLAEMLRLKADS